MADEEPEDELLFSGEALDNLRRAVFCTAY